MKSKLFRPRNVWLALALCCPGVFYLTRSGQSAQKQAILDVKSAINKGDTSFVTVVGVTISVPGIPGGAQNGLILAHGKKPPIGYGDSFRIESWQNAAEDYAQAYNVYLFKYLLDNPDQKTKLFLKEVRQDLKRFEHRNAKTDALRSFNSSPTFLGVFGSEDFGFPSEDSRASWVQMRWLQMNAPVLRGAELQKFNRIMKTYVVPYNQTLYQQLKQRWNKQGRKNLAAR